VPCFGPMDQQVADLGSGGGLPGIPLAIALPATRFLLVEARGRRGAFLEVVVERLSLANVEVIVARADQVHRVVDVVTTRALAPVLQTWRLAEPLLNARGRVLYFAGRGWAGREAAMSVPDAIVVNCIPAKLEWEGPIVMISRKPPGARAAGFVRNPDGG